MIVRIVKMEFHESELDRFREIFEANKAQIRSFPGCEFLELYQGTDNPCIFFTYSYWETEAHLNAYRESAFFKDLWPKTKALFSQKPQAWSVNKIVSLK
ncbi:putative quinol monooxygenase [Croceiramulus getboli]|nr:antibiotic biosynthesis monooxygenase [Flavobacteriaceae bacterium YJPT1-3]